MPTIQAGKNFMVNGGNNLRVRNVSRNSVATVVFRNNMRANLGGNIVLEAGETRDISLPNFAHDLFVVEGVVSVNQ